MLHYSLDQFDLFSIILLLKKTGSTLEEIKEYISNYNTQSFLEILTQKQLKLNEEIKSMKNLSAFLSLTIATLKENILNGKFQANYNSLKEVYEKIYNQIKDKGYKVDGNIYEEDLIDYFSENNPEKFILKISLQVK